MPRKTDRCARRSALRRRAVLGALAGSTAALAGSLADTEFSIADVRVPTAADGPLSFEVTVLDADVLVDSPGAFELSATNESDERLELVSRGVRPFGVLELRGESDYGSAWIDLWADAYAESDHVDVSPGGMSVDGEELVTTLESGESASADYEIRGDEVPNSDGTYDLRGELGDDAVARYRRPNGETGGEAADGETDTESDEHSEPSGTGLDPEIEFRIETRSRIPFR